jgi:poly(A) polymerase
MSADACIARDRFRDMDVLRRGGLRKVLLLFDGTNEEIRIVGGAVRNTMLGLPVTEVDLATTALPREVMERAAVAGLKPVPTGIEHGTVTVIVDGEAFEVTTLRADVETDGRHAVVRFGRSFAQDALRRDFTINALYATADGEVLDYVGGLADLAARRVRFIGDPHARVREDYLRILRFFRFHAAYGEGSPDAAGLEAVISERRGLAHLSRERVRAELMKLLVTRRYAEVAMTMSEAGLLLPLLGGIALPERLRRLAAIGACDQNAPDALLNLAGLAVLVVEDAQRLRENLRLSNDEATRLAQAAQTLAGLHARSAPPDEARLLELLFLNGRRALCDALRLAQAESRAEPDAADWQAAGRLATTAPIPRLPIGGAELLQQGIPAGPRVGQVLKAFQAAWIRAGFPREPERLNDLLESVMAHTHPADRQDSPS